MLLRVSPVSSRSFRLMVMDVESGFDGLEFASVVAGVAGGLASAISSADGKEGAFGDGSAFFSAGPVVTGGSSGGGSPEPGAAVGGTVCGLATSMKLITRRRV